MTDKVELQVLYDSKDKPAGSDLMGTLNLGSVHHLLGSAEKGATAGDETGYPLTLGNHTVQGRLFVKVEIEAAVKAPQLHIVSCMPVYPLCTVDGSRCWTSTLAHV